MLGQKSCSREVPSVTKTVREFKASGTYSAGRSAGIPLGDSENNHRVFEAPGLRHLNNQEK